jgi:hypothetical protein
MLGLFLFFSFKRLIYHLFQGEQLEYPSEVIRGLLLDFNRLDNRFIGTNSLEDLV